MRAKLDQHHVRLITHAKALEDRLFALGEMHKAPCFCCGYNGPNYYQPSVHKCAARHHKLYLPYATSTKFTP
jgi:hypothetical protein